MSTSHRDRSSARRRSEPARRAAAGLLLASGIGWTIGVPVDWMNPEIAAATSQTTATQTSNSGSDAKTAADGSATTATSKAAPSAASTPVKAQTENSQATNAQTTNSPAPASKAQVVTGKAGSSATVVASRPARVATSRPNSKTARTASTTGVTTIQTLAPQDERVTYQYNALGRRDPFRPLVGGGFIGADQSSAPPDIGGIRVVGIVWGADDKFALVEDPRGSSLVLRKGDKVVNGVVETLRRDAVVVKLNIDGQTQSVAIPLSRKGDQANESE